MEEYEVLEELCKPIKQYLDENYNPHYSVVVNSETTKIIAEKVVVPFDWKTK